MGKRRPGILIYFDLLPAIQRLSMEQRGELFTAMLSYGVAGEIADLDQITGLVFDLIRPKIDRDAERYEESCVQRRYAVYCREAKKDGANPLPFEKWVISGHIDPISPDIGSYPTTTTTTTTTTTPTTTTTTTTARAETSVAEEEKKGGPGEKERESALFHQLTKEQQIEFLRSG